ncbi:MAG: arsenate reductase (glutaredoxin) [Pseudomonadota bacterium]
MTEIWHNPRCSKSRQTLALLQERGAVDVRLYLQDAPTAEEIAAALQALDMPAAKLMRRGEAVFKELGLAKETDEAALVAAMAANPILIERPVVFANGKAALGRPPEAVLDIL